MTEFEVTERNKLKRYPKRGSYDTETIYPILDEALLCHVSFAIDGQPFIIPTIHARQDDRLLIHGLTDSPYSMKALAESLHARAFEVTVLRMPGHGTLPSMMTEMSTRDWTAAVRIAARDVAARATVGQPFYIGGYSTGGTLALQYALDALEDPALRRPDRVLLVSPAIELTPVAALARFYKIESAEVLVVHDELDLLPGGIRIKQGGGAGGHNGIKDIQSQLGTPEFWRLRLGIGHPRNLNPAQDVADYVLHRPRKDEQEAIDRALDRCLLAWPKLAVGDYAAAQQLLHGKTV